MNGVHDFWTGVHWTQMNTALSPMAMFMEMMMNQIIAFIHLSVSRSMVRAKLVLDQMAAVIENVPAMLAVKTILFMRSTSNGRSQICKP